MRVLPGLLIVALAATPIGASASARLRPSLRGAARHPPGRRAGARILAHEGGDGGAQRHAFWRHDGGDGGFERHHHHGFFGPIGAFVATTDEAAPAAIEPTPSPFVVAAPVFVNVTFAPAGGSQRESTAGPQQEWVDGPRLIEIGRQAPRRGHLPLIVYGD